MLVSSWGRDIGVTQTAANQHSSTIPSRLLSGLLLDLHRQGLEDQAHRPGQHRRRGTCCGKGIRWAARCDRHLGVSRFAKFWQQKFGGCLQVFIQNLWSNANMAHTSVSNKWGLLSIQAVVPGSWIFLGCVERSHLLWSGWLLQYLLATTATSLQRVSLGGALGYSDPWPHCSPFQWAIISIFGTDHSFLFISRVSIYHVNIKEGTSLYPIFFAPHSRGTIWCSDHCSGHSAFRTALVASKSAIHPKQSLSTQRWWEKKWFLTPSLGSQKWWTKAIFRLNSSWYLMRLNYHPPILGTLRNLTSVAPTLRSLFQSTWILPVLALSGQMTKASRHGVWHAGYGLEAATGPWLVEYQRGVFKKYSLHVYCTWRIGWELWWSQFKYKLVLRFLRWLVEKWQRPARAGCGVNATHRTRLVRSQGTARQKKFENQPMWHVEITIHSQLVTWTHTHVLLKQFMQALALSIVHMCILYDGHFVTTPSYL